VTVEWNQRKAAANLKKHRVAFEDAATVFLDPLATTFPDPDHSPEESREITIGCTLKGHVVFVSHCGLKKGTDHSVPTPNKFNPRKCRIVDRAVCPLFPVKDTKRAETV
jgi:uncharacterized DUF497 family protein